MASLNNCLFNITIWISRAWHKCYFNLNQCFNLVFLIFWLKEWTCCLGSWETADSTSLTAGSVQLYLTAFIKLTAAIKPISPKYVSNDTWSPAGHLCRKLCTKILSKPMFTQSWLAQAQIRLQSWDFSLWKQSTVYFCFSAIRNI